MRFNPFITGGGSYLRGGTRLLGSSQGLTINFRGMVLFDRKVIRSNWKAINETPLKRAGLLVRRIARNSIRRVANRNRYSAPGNPPFSHYNKSKITGQSLKNPPFKLIYSLPNYYGTHLSTIVGMVGFGGPGPPVPGLHEHGGSAMRSVFKVVGKGPKGGAIRKPVMTRAHYPPRPFMRPALMKAKATLPHLWRNSISRVG